MLLAGVLWSVILSFLVVVVLLQLTQLVNTYGADNGVDMFVLGERSAAAGQLLVQAERC